MTIIKSSSCFQLKSIYPIAIETTKKLIAHVDEKLTKPYDIRELCSKYTCDLMCDSLFSVDGHSLTSDNPEIYGHCKKIMEGVLSAFTARFPKQMFPPESSTFFKRHMIDSIRHRNEITHKRDDFLTHIIGLQSSKSISEDEMVAQMWTIFMDSFETGSAALYFTLYELAMNQNVQNKLRTLIIANLDGDDKHMSFDKILELEYLDQVFYEALRLHPPLMYLTRVCSEPYEIDGAKGHKYQMQKGDVALISVHSIHRDPGEKKKFWGPIVQFFFIVVLGRKLSEHFSFFIIFWFKIRKFLKNQNNSKNSIFFS